MQKKNKSKIIIIILFQLILLWTLEGVLQSYTGWKVDDAYISYRYAENFANGEGLVFNLGEKVEGYTNFLWVIILSAAIKPGFDIVIFSMILSMLLSGATIVLIFYFTRLFIGKETLSVFHFLPGFLLIVYFPFLAWGIGGLETHLFVFLLTLSFYLIVKGNNDLAASICFGLCALTRPEGLVFFGITWLYILFIRTKDKQKLIKFTIPFIIIYIPYFLWRFYYYGYLLPNTFYVKVGFGYHQLIRGLKYFFDFVRQSGSIPILAPLLWLISIRFVKDSRKFWGYSYLLIITFLYYLYLIYTGGDALPALRLSLPIIPVVYIFWSHMLKNMSDHIYEKKYRNILIISVVLGSLLITSSVFYLNMMLPCLKGDGIWLYGRKIGEYFRENAKPEETIATNTAGSIPFYSKTRSIDMLGLCDEHIAHRDDIVIGPGVTGHEKYDGVYVLSRIPEYIIFGNSLQTGPPVFMSDYEITGLKYFYDYYQKKIGRNDGYSFTYYELKDRDRNNALLELGNYYFDRGIYREAIETYSSLPTEIKPEDKIEFAKTEIENEIGWFCDFEDGTFDGWIIKGDAFGEIPNSKNAPMQGPVSHWQGRYFANSYALGTDQKQGELISEPFMIEGDEISFLVAGCNNQELCSVKLIIGNVILSAGGQNTEEFNQAKWDVSKYKGETAGIEIIDKGEGFWGHIMVDNIRQYKKILTY